MERNHGQRSFHYSINFSSPDGDPDRTPESQRETAKLVVTFLFVLVIFCVLFFVSFFARFCGLAGGWEWDPGVPLDSVWEQCCCHRRAAARECVCFERRLGGAEGCMAFGILFPRGGCGDTSWSFSRNLPDASHSSDEMNSENMTFQIKSTGDLMDALERWLRANNHTSADSRISLQSLLSVHAIQELQRQHIYPSHVFLEYLQRHPNRVQIDDADTERPWIYSIIPVQQGPLHATDSCHLPVQPTVPPHFTASAKPDLAPFKAFPPKSFRSSAARTSETMAHGTTNSSDFKRGIAFTTLGRS